LGDLTGETLLGKYKLTGLLGRGGMGAVYQGTHLRTGRKVAVKVLDDRFLANRSIVQRFGREARAASSIEHPGIAEVLDLDQLPDGAPFLVMELLDGETLGSFIERKKRLSQAEALEIFEQLLEALDAAHERGIVHRDLKPDNIFLLPPSHSGKRVVKILDFGISQKADEVRSHLTQTGAVLGTPHYMSPEQALGESDLDARADIYAAAVVLYECVVGDVPYDAANYNALLQAILRAAPVRPREHGAKISVAFEAALLTGMAKDKSKRPASAAAWRLALIEAANAEPGRVTAPPRGADKPVSVPPAKAPPVELELRGGAAEAGKAGAASSSEPSASWGEFATLGRKPARTPQASSSPLPPAEPTRGEPPPGRAPSERPPAESRAVASTAGQSLAGKELDDFGLAAEGPALELDDAALAAPRGRVSVSPASRTRSQSGTLPAVTGATPTGPHSAQPPLEASRRAGATGPHPASSLPAPASAPVGASSLPGGDLPEPDPEPTAAPATRGPSVVAQILERIKGLPAAVHLAVLAVVVLGVIILVIRLAVGRGDEEHQPLDSAPPEVVVPRAPVVEQPSPTVLVDISGLPPEARIRLDGLPVGALPLRVRRGEHHVLEIEATGYEPRRIVITPDQDTRVSAELRLVR
jgi:serine/threonine-protein kinase